MLPTLLVGPFASTTNFNVCLFVQEFLAKFSYQVSCPKNKLKVSECVYMRTGSRKDEVYI